jgi:hypothetical protein
MLQLMMRVLSWIVILGFGAGVQAVQSAPVDNARYVIKGEMVFYDKWTDLTWQRCSVGQRWVNGSGCVGMVKTFTFSDAQRQGQGMWRVPTKEELQTLIDYRRRANTEKPAIDETVFPDMDMARLVYWSSTAAGASDGWGVYFDNGYPGNYDRSAPYSVRLVRGGQ